MKSKTQVLRQIVILSLGAIFSISACNSQKETVASRNMQNLTAQFNILFNANEIVNASEKIIQQAQADNYDRVISVFKEPNESISQSELSKLDQAILKANTIANEKSQSKYVDDAYFLIGKSNHLKSNFYNAVEFFDYVYLNYPNAKGLKQASLAWKTRSLIAADRLDEAFNTIDSALKYINTEKKSVAEIYAIKAQLHIYTKEDDLAINMLKKAIGSKTSKQNKIRWTYLLSQLQQINGQTEDAYENYTKVLKSNADFEMAFNAKLSALRLNLNKNKENQDKTNQLIALLKDSKNIDFQDQIYFQIANSYAENNEIDKAIENYKNSILRSTKNEIQKGLSYLKLAEIYFNESDFVQSKAYYDSTLLSLPEIYPDYLQIKNKADNIELIADRLSTIAKEDTLQMLASLPEDARNIKIDAIVELEEIKTQTKLINEQSGTKNTSLTIANIGNIKFYFNNSIAINQGIADFKKTWGSRKLEDNWRRSQKSATDISNNLANNQAISADLPKDNAISNNISITDSLKKQLIESIPLTAEMKIASNEKIGAAMYDIGNYYREVANDTLEAVNIYEGLLNRFPEDPNKLAVYYNLYRLYKSVNPQLSDKYKNILINQFPESPFAKIILDPDYNQKNDEKELAFNKFYNDVYELYTSKKYAEVLKSIEKEKSKSSDAKIPAQLAYLNSLALGHLNKLDKFEASFKEIVESNPEDQLIVPLIKVQLAFIDSNRKEMTQRPFALLDNETIINSIIDEPTYENLVQEEPVAQKQVEEKVAIPVEEKKSINPIKEEIKEEPKVQAIEQPKIEVKKELETKKEVMDAFFELSDSDNFYFIVNVSDPTLNLSSSRFGIGQFNRVNYSGSGLKHQLKAISDQNQLIFVGPLNSQEEVKNYFEKINPLMRDIMKIPASSYNTFYISSKNFDKITDLATLERYINFYKKNFNK